MRVAATLLALVTLASCEFAVKHPAATIGIVGGGVAAGTCELGTGGEHATCGIVTASVGLGLAGIVWLAMLIGGDGNTVLQAPDDPPRPDVPQDPTLDQPKPEPNTEPAPSTP